MRFHLGVARNNFNGKWSIERREVDSNIIDVLYEDYFLLEIDKEYHRIIGNIKTDFKIVDRAPLFAAQQWIIYESCLEYFKG